MDNQIKSKWEFLLQCKPDVRGMIGNAKSSGGHINHNGNHEKFFHFIITKGSFSYNESTGEFERKLEIR
jgi:hypothetical protein